MNTTILLLVYMRAKLCVVLYYFRNFHDDVHGPFIFKLFEMLVPKMYFEGHYKAQKETAKGPPTIIGRQRRRRELGARHKVLL